MKRAQLFPQNQNCLTDAIKKTYPNAQIQPGAQAVGGHDEISFTIDQQDLPSADDVTAFGNNWLRGSQVFNSLHINGIGQESIPDPQNGIYTLQGHFDVLNPATGVFGIVGHSTVDYAFGQLLDLLYKLGILSYTSNLLDPACVNQ